MVNFLKILFAIALFFKLQALNGLSFLITKASRLPDSTKNSKLFVFVGQKFKKIEFGTRCQIN